MEGSVIYRLAPGGVIRVSDGAFIPEDEGNRDYREYLDWCAQGGEALPSQTAEEKQQQQEAAERVWRDAELDSTQWPVARHRDEKDAGTTTTLSATQFAALLTYRQALRDWPAAAGFPDSAQRPAPPDWLAAALAST